MGTSGQEQTLFVVASTDLERSAIMIERIRGQFEKMEELKIASEFDIRASAVPLPDNSTTLSLEQQVQMVADRVTLMSQESMGSKMFGPYNPKVN